MTPCCRPPGRASACSAWSSSSARPFALMRDVDSDRGIVAILGMSGVYSDVMPSELAHASDVMVELSNGQQLAREARMAPDAPAFTVVTSSAHYPLRSIISVDKGALPAWDQEPYTPIIGLSFMLGIAFAGLLVRAANQPSDPVQELDRAIANSEFEPYFQPVFDLRTRQIVGAELLARWVLADGTVVPPARFIELAERSGRIGAITWQLLSKALAAMQPLLTANRTFNLSINITAHQFVAPGFVTELRSVVNAARIATRQITLELTEHRGVRRSPARRRRGRRGSAARFYGRDRRCRDRPQRPIANTGPKPEDILKVDKYFVDYINRDVSAQSVVGMLVRLARDMGMDIVAEGIETEEQADALLVSGVRRGQGYLVAAPMPLSSFMAFAVRPVDDRQSTVTKVA